MIDHPVGPRAAALFHGFIAGLYILGLWFHGLSAWYHWRDRS